MLNSHYFGNFSMQTKYLSFVMKHFLQSSKLHQENEHGSSMYTCLTISFSLFYSIVSILLEMQALCIRINKCKITFLSSFQIHRVVWLSYSILKVVIVWHSKSLWPFYTDFCLYLQGMVKVCVTSSRLCLHRKQQWLSPPWFPWCRIKLWDSSKGLRD